MVLTTGLHDLDKPRGAFVVESLDTKPETADRKLMPRAIDLRIPARLVLWDTPLRES